MDKLTELLIPAKPMYLILEQYCFSRGLNYDLNEEKGFTAAFEHYQSTAIYLN